MESTGTKVMKWVFGVLVVLALTTGVISGFSSSAPSQENVQTESMF